jgi:hypothetical protein
MWTSVHNPQTSKTGSIPTHPLWLKTCFLETRVWWTCPLRSLEHGSDSTSFLHLWR